MPQLPHELSPLECALAGHRYRRQRRHRSHEPLLRSGPELVRRVGLPHLPAGCLRRRFPEHAIRPGGAGQAAAGEIKNADPRKFDFTYYRDEDLAKRSYELATAFYDGQRGGAEKVAGLYHRMAWVERGRGDQDEEKKWLKKARDSYEKAFTSSDAAKAGVLWAYLIGELDARIGDYMDAVKWFQVAAQQPDFKSQPLLEKMVRDRQQEVADKLRAAKAAG